MTTSHLVQTTLSSQPSTAAIMSQRQIPGLVGMSPRTNAIYYTEMHEEGDRLLGTPVSFRSVMVSPDFGAMIHALNNKDTDAFEKLLVDASRQAVAAGADYIVVLSNTGSTFAAALAPQCGVPVLGIVDFVIQAAKMAGHSRVGLLSTVHTARSGVYANAGRAEGVAFIDLPDNMGEFVNELIVTDIALGQPTLEARAHILKAIDCLRDAGAEAVALACTDLTLLGLQPGETSLPVLDSTLLHARAAAAAAVFNSLTQ